MRRPVLTVVGIAFGVIALLLVAAAIAIWTVDVNTLIAPVRERVKAATGRDLAINGGISLKLSLEPRIEMRDVTLSNASWAHGPNLITAKRLDAELALLPLISRKFDLKRLSLTEPVITLETDTRGQGNWELRAASGDKAANAPSQPTDAASAIIGVGDITIERGTITYRNGRTGHVTTIAVERLDLSTRDLNAPVNATFRGTIDGVPVALTGNAGPLAALIEHRWPYPVSLDGDIAQRKAKVDTKLAMDTTGTHLDDLHLTLGSSSFTGSVSMQDDAGKPRTMIRLESPRVALADLALPAAAVASQPPSPQASPPAPPTHAAATVLSSEPLPLSALRDSNIEVDLVLGELVTRDGRSWKAVHARFTSQNQRIDAPVLEAQAFGGRLRATLAIDARQDPPQVHLTLAGDDLDLATLIAAAGANTGIHGGKTQLRAELRAQGRSLHELASRASGTINADVGTASLSKTPSKDSAVAELIGTILPVASVGSATQLHCAVVRLPVRDGVAHANRSIGVETEKVGLVATGTIDFGNETVDLAVRPSIAGGGRFDLGQIAGLVHWRGPWRNASVTLDAVSSVSTVAGIGSLLAGGPIGPIAGVLVPKVLSKTAPEAGACTVARGGHG